MTTPLLSIQDLSASFKADPKEIQAVQNLSFSIYPQETVAIVGESGSGKSVTAFSILKLLPYPKAFHPSGSIIWEEQDLLKASEPTLQRIRGNTIGMVFQEPMTSLNPLHTIEKQLTESLLLHGNYKKKEIPGRILELLHLVHLRDPEKRLKAYPHQLSGGERQRIMIAMAIANNPKLLIADEPTTALDVTIQAEILDLLKELQHRLKMAVLLISHDIDVVRYTAHRVLVMHHGKLVEEGTLPKIFTHPKENYTKHLIASEPKGLAIPLSVSLETSPPLLKAKNITVDFPIEKSFFGKILESYRALDNVSFHVQPGETLGIIGESGSGKTTLALSLLRFLKAQGDISFEGADLQNLSGKALLPFRRFLQVVFQDPFSSLNPRLSVSQIIAEGLKVYNLAKTKKEALTQVESILEKVGLDASYLWRYPHELSGGQRQRISLARALIINPKLLILDEPTSALDRSVQSQLLDLLKELQKEKQISYLFISHDLKVIQSIAHRVLVLQKGKIVEQGNTLSILKNPKDPYTQRLLKAAHFSV